jgi:hypothetical protein
MWQGDVSYATFFDSEGGIILKRFMEITVQFKFVWGIFFTAAIIIYTTASMVLGNKYMDLIVVWQLVGLTMVITLYHYLFFGELILNSLGIKLKVIIHSILCYITLLIACELFNWLDAMKLKELAIFTGIYIFSYLACIYSFYIYYKSTGEELNQRLTAYKQNRNTKS